MDAKIFKRVSETVYGIRAGARAGLYRSFLYHINFHYAVAAFWALLITMLTPMIFFPFAVIWFGIAEMLNIISSWLVLHIVFFILVVPVGMVRKWRGKDTMKLKQFKKSRLSVMTIRDHLYEAADLKNTFKK
jgi:ABC-type nitrate/sulfonate/bicarbonate transport system permease component